MEIEDGVKQCEGKNCYSKAKAERVARSVMKKRNRVVRVYECYKCFYFHLTSESLSEYSGRTKRKEKYNRNKQKKFKAKW